MLLCLHVRLTYGDRAFGLQLYAVKFSSVLDQLAVQFHLQSLQMAKSCYHYPLILETVIMFQIRNFDDKKKKTIVSS